MRQISATHRPKDQPASVDLMEAAMNEPKPRQSKVFCFFFSKKKALSFL
jgi:hypothetical protein